MTHRLPTPGVVEKVVQGVGGALDAAVGVLPDPLATRIRETRKAIVGGASTLLGVVTALQVLPLPEDATPYVAFAIVVLGAIATWGVPNAKPTTG